MTDGSLGRGHAPCNVSGYAGYPYAGGRLGVWGYDIVNKELIDPDDYRDVMGYCDPEWISDHHFERFFARISYVNQQAVTSFAPTTRTPWRSLIIDPDGAKWGRGVDLAKQPHGVPTQVRFLTWRMR